MHPELQYIALVVNHIIIIKLLITSYLIPHREILINSSYLPSSLAPFDVSLGLLLGPGSLVHIAVH